MYRDDIVATSGSQDCTLGHCNFHTLVPTERPYICCESKGITLSLVYHQSDSLTGIYLHYKWMAQNKRLQSFTQILYWYYHILLCVVKQNCLARLFLSIVYVPDQGLKVWLDVTFLQFTFIWCAVMQWNIVCPVDMIKLKKQDAGGICCTLWVEPAQESFGWTTESI